jgi:hypothetical protein
MTKRSEVEKLMRAALGEQAVIAGIADERDQDRDDAIATIANVLHWLEREEGDADPEDVLDMALHHFVVERADAPGWERIRAVSVDRGEWIAEDEGNAPKDEGRRVEEAEGIGGEKVGIRFAGSDMRESFHMDALVWRKV